MKQLSARIRIDIPTMLREMRRVRDRKHYFYKRMKAQGVRGTSIHKYLRRGFPGPFEKALQLEMQQLITDMNRDWL